MGKYEGDMIDVGHFSGRKIPKPVLVNVLKVISKTIGEDVTSSKFRRGQYDDTEIPIFGQLMAFLTGTF